MAVCCACGERGTAAAKAVCLQRLFFFHGGSVSVTHCDMPGACLVCWLVRRLTDEPLLLVTLFVYV
jgi:hypothetical protein